MKKTTSIILAFCMLVSLIAVSFNLSVTVYADSINDEDVFVKQSRSGRCTLASAVMMLRRRAIIDDIADWENITEDTTCEVAWTSAGLYNNFTFEGMVVGYGTFTGDFEEKKELLISLLKEHPEGISIYNRDAEKMHAVLATDYDEEDDVFYCADPAGGIEHGRIPIVYAWLPGETQQERIESLDNYWYITNRSGGNAEETQGCHIISNTSNILKKGSYGNTVMELQIALNAVMDAGLVVDSDFGSLTEQALIDFQNEYGLVADGITGKETYDKLNELFGEHVHEFEKYIEETHPHKEYKECSCGYKSFNGKNGAVEDCRECFAINIDNQIIFTIGKTDVIVFGEEKENDVAPQIVNDRTMLPARILVESLGAEIEWVQGKTGTVQIVKDDKVVILCVGEDVASINDDDVLLDSPAYIDNDRIYVPVRFLAEVFGTKVVWNNETRQVVITKE